MMSIPRIALQLWSVENELKSNYEHTLELIADLGFEGVEFSGEFGPFIHNPVGLLKKLNELKLRVAGAHIDFKYLGDQYLTKTIEFYRTLETQTVVIPWDERAWHPEKIHLFINQLNYLSKTLARYSMRIGYHNHQFEFQAYKNGTYWDYIAENTLPEVVLQLDVGWAAHAGANPVEYIQRYPGRTQTVHYRAGIQNTRGNVSHIIGEDGLDWQGLIKANIIYGDTQWLIVEQETAPKGISKLQAVLASKQALDRSINYINS